MPLNKQFLEAVKDGKPVSVLEDLLNKGADVDYIDEKRQNAYFYFKTEEVGWFLYSKKIANVENNEYEYPIDHALSNNDIVRFKTLTDMGFLLTFSGGEYSFSKHTKPELFKLLKVSCIGRFNVMEETAYNCRKNKDLFCFVIDLFDDIMDWGHVSINLLNNMVKKNKFNLGSVEYFVKRSNIKRIEHSLQWAVIYDNIDLLNVFLTRKPDLNVYKELFTFIKSRQTLEILLDNGLNIDMYISNPMKTMKDLLDSSDTLFIDIIDILVKHGLDINAVDDNNENILFHIKELDANTIYVLKDLGININSQCNKGNNILMHVLLQNDQKDLIKALVDSGADILMKNTSGEYPLKHVDSIEDILLLLESKNINYKEIELDMLQKLVSDKKYIPVIEMLYEKGVDFSEASECIDDKDIEYGIKRLVYRKPSDGKIDMDLCTLLYAITTGKSRNRLYKYVERMDCYHSLYSKTWVYKDSIKNVVDGHFIFEAVKEGRKDIIERMLKLGEDINIVQDGKDLLWYAKTPDMIRFLVDKGATGKTIYEHGTNILYHVEDKDIMEYLINKGVDAHHRLKYGSNLITHFAKKRDVFPILEILIKNNVDVNESHDGYGNSALMLSIILNNIDNTKCLLKHGADVNIIGQDNHTVFTLAADNARESLYKVLLDSDYNLDTEGVLDVAFLADALEQVLAKGVDINGSKNTLLMRVKTVEEAKRLLDLGLDVNRINEKGETPLFDAVKVCNKDVIKFLVDNGARVDIINKSNETILFNAAIFGNEEIFKILETEETLYHENHRGENALFRAIYYANKSVYKYLLNKNFDLYKETLYGKTCIKRLRDIDIGTYKSLFIKTDEDKMFSKCKTVSEIETLLDNKNVFPSNIRFLIPNGIILTCNDEEVMKKISETNSIKILRAAITRFPEYKYIPNKYVLDLYDGKLLYQKGTDIEKYIISPHEYIKDIIKNRSFLFKLKGDFLIFALNFLGCDCENITDISDENAIRIFKSTRDKIRFVKLKYPKVSDETIKMFDLDKEHDIDCSLCLCPLAGIPMASECCPTSSYIHKECYNKSSFEKCVICRKPALYV